MGAPQAVFIADTHCSSQLGLCPPGRFRLDEGGYYTPNAIQKKLWKMHCIFWHEWVPEVTQGEPYAVVHAGDAIDYRHHDTTDLVSANIADQQRMFIEIMRPLVAGATQFFQVRGTKAHSGPSSEAEEGVARELGAVPNERGQHAREELWLEIGKGLVNVVHHIGTTSSSAYESTAPMKELVDGFTEAGRWRDRAPDVVIRAHRHRYLEVRIPSALGYAITLTLPGWQAKTGWSYRLAGARLAPTQVGGVIVRQGDEDLYTRAKVWSIGRPKTEKIHG